jgi:CheY-like chemotaxis protein
VLNACIADDHPELRRLRDATRSRSIELMVRLMSLHGPGRPIPHSLAQRRVLVVEDIYLVAIDIEAALRAAGAEVLGPYSCCRDALQALQTARIDAAALDILLHEETVYPVAEVLRTAGVPFVFVTGCEADLIPADFVDTPLVAKPFTRNDVVAAVAAACQALANDGGLSRP